MKERLEIDPRAKRNAIIFLAVAAGVLWFPVAQLLLGDPPGFLRDLGFLSGPGGTPVAWFLAGVVALFYAAFAVGNIPLVRQHWRAVSAAKLLGVLAAVGAAVVEEAFFRRMIMDAILAAGGHVLAQIIIAGLIFGLAHGIWGFATRQIVAGVGAVIATGTLGIALGIVYVIGNRSLAPVIISHFVIDAVIQPGIMYAAFSGQMPRPAAGWWRITSR